MAMLHNWNPKRVCNCITRPFCAILIVGGGVGVGQDALIASLKLENDNLVAQVRTIEQLVSKFKEGSKRRMATIAETTRALRVSEQMWKQKFEELDTAAAASNRTNRALKEYVDNMKDALETSV
jgi:tellurite resistance protein